MLTSDKAGEAALPPTPPCVRRRIEGGYPYRAVCCLTLLANKVPSIADDRSAHSQDAVVPFWLAHIGEGYVGRGWSSLLCEILLIPDV